MEIYKNSIDFNYIEKQPIHDNILQRLHAWVASFFQLLLGNPNSGDILGIILKVVLITGFIIAVFLILRLKYGSPVSKNKGSFADKMKTESISNPEDFRKLYNAFKEKKEYLQAFRYLYLWTLGSLAETNQIKLHSWKTPYDYYVEIPDSRKKHYQELYVLYEAVYFGDYPADKEKLLMAEGLKKELLDE